MSILQTFLLIHYWNCPFSIVFFWEKWLEKGEFEKKHHLFIRFRCLWPATSLRKKFRKDSRLIERSRKNEEGKRLNIIWRWKSHWKERFVLHNRQFSFRVINQNNGYWIVKNIWLRAGVSNYFRPRATLRLFRCFMGQIPVKKSYKTKKLLSRAVRGRMFPLLA